MIQTEISESNLKDDKSSLLEKKINSINLIENIPKFKVFNISDESKKNNLTPKKRGRRKKFLINVVGNTSNQSFKIINEIKVHNIYSNDNIKRRIKTLFNNYIIKLLNDLIKQKFSNFNIKFVKLNKRINEDL